MYKFEQIILIAGHTPNSSFDRGASHEGHREELQTIVITDRIVKNLKNQGYNVHFAPHNLDFIQATAWVKNNFNINETLIIEIHRDGFAGDFRSTIDEISKRMLVLHPKNNSYTINLANAFVNSFKNQGASKNSRAIRRDDLYLINNLNSSSLLIECGFIRGLNTLEHMYWLSDVISNAIFSITGGKQNQITNNEKDKDNMLKKLMLKRINDSTIITGETKNILVNDFSAGNQSVNAGLYVIEELERQMTYNLGRENEMKLLNTKIESQKVTIEENKAIMIELEAKILNLDLIVTRLQEEAKNTTTTQDLIVKWDFNHFFVGLAKYGLTDVVLLGIGQTILQVTLDYFNQSTENKNLAGLVGAILVVVIPTLKGLKQIGKDNNK